MSIFDRVNIDMVDGTFSQQYCDFVRVLAKPLENKTMDLLHAAVGISGEAGELLDAIKKVWIYNKPEDRENIIEELGDLNFYMTHMQNILGVTDEEILEHNVKKLQKRYPGGYKDEHAIARLDKVEEERVAEYVAAQLKQKEEEQLKYGVQAAEPESEKRINIFPPKDPNAVGMDTEKQFPYTAQEDEAVYVVSSMKTDVINCLYAKGFYYLEAAQVYAPSLGSGAVITCILAKEAANWRCIGTQSNSVGVR